MTQKRLSEIIVYTEGLRDSAHARIVKHNDDSCLQAQALGSHASLSCMLSILRAELPKKQITNKIS